MQNLKRLYLTMEPLKENIFFGFFLIHMGQFNYKINFALVACLGRILAIWSNTGYYKREKIPLNQIQNFFFQFFIV